MTNEIMSAVLSLFLTGGGDDAVLKVTAVDDAEQDKAVSFIRIETVMDIEIGDKETVLPGS